MNTTGDRHARTMTDAATDATDATTAGVEGDAAGGGAAGGGAAGGGAAGGGPRLARVTVLVAGGALLLTGGILAVLLLNRPASAVRGLLLGALTAAVLAGVLVAVRGLVGVGAGGGPRPGGAVRAGAAVARIAGAAVIVATLLALGAGVVAGAPAGAATEPVVEVSVVTVGMPDHDGALPGDDGALPFDDGALPFDDGAFPGGAGSGRLLLVRAVVPGWAPGTSVRGDLVEVTAEARSILATRIGVTSNVGVAVVVLQAPTATSGSLVLEIRTSRRQCTAPIALSQVGQVPVLTCTGRR
jgi:hypothetical protein